jgi:demethylmenaquinone methyltransferase/2-methoxy-6-polyprenyl-1,4-benzoquinol methylase
MGRGMADYPLKDFYSDIYPTYDRVNRVFTFGRDRYWRKKAAAALLSHHPRQVLDLCTGTGDFILELASVELPPLTLCGYDFNREMMEEAKRKYEQLAVGQPMQPVDFIEGDVGNMPFQEGQFDAIGITFGLRNLVFQNSRAGKHLSEIRRVLKDGGHLVVLESSRPTNGVWRFFNAIYLRLILPYLGGAISGNLAAYRYLAESSRNYYSISEMEKILEQAGFGVTSASSLFLGSVMLVVAVRK